MSRRLPPTAMPTMPWSNPLMTLPLPRVNARGVLPIELSNCWPLLSGAVEL